MFKTFDTLERAEHWTALHVAQTTFVNLKIKRVELAASARQIRRQITPGPRSPGPPGNREMLQAQLAYYVLLLTEFDN